MPDSRLALSARLADSAEDLRAVQALRYDVFVRELGGDGAGVDHAAGLERDRFDDFSEHMLVEDEATGEVVAVYRLLREDQARAAGGFYSETEYDLAPLKRSGRRLMELGRSCLHRDYRGGMAMFHLWNALAEHVARHGIELLFGTASFHGTDPVELAQPLSLLHHAHLAPEELRVRSTAHQPMDLLAPEALDRRAAMLAMPALIKAYLRLGGVVGDGAFVDREFNTTDICLILDTAVMSERNRRIYGGAVGR